MVAGYKIKRESNKFGQGRVEISPRIARDNIGAKLRLHFDSSDKRE